MTNQFEGIVINPGSPNDGKKKSSKTSFLRLNETPLEAPSFPKGDGAVPHTERMKTADYVFVPVHTENGGRWGFWVPDGHGVSWLIDTLIAGYRRARK